MKTLLISLLAILILFSIGYSQAKVDVVYLKNGDIRKGVIIENVPNDYIRIEAADGSIFTIKYADIDKMTKEEKIVTQQIPVTHEVKSGLMARSGDFGITAGLWLGGVISFDDYYYPEHDKNPGFFAKIFYDAYLMDKFAAGLYFSISPVTLSGYDEGATMFEVGGSFKPRFPLADGAAVIKPGLSIGYRFYSSDVPVVNDSQGLGIDGSIEIQFDAKSIVVPFFEIGLLSQPVGGTHGETDITFGPIFYFGGGIVF
jgi:hypothetical protein